MAENEDFKIANILREMSNLLSKFWHKNRASILEEMAYKYEYYVEERKEIINWVIRGAGGQGSLSDVYFEKEGVYLETQTEKYKKLLDELYEECKKEKIKGRVIGSLWVEEK